MEINNILDAIRKLGSIVDQTFDDINSVALFIDSYDVFDNAQISLDFSKEVRAGVIELDLEDVSDFYSTDELLNTDLWDTYLVQKEKTFSTIKTPIIKPIEQDNAFLTKEIVNNITPMSTENTLLFNRIKASDDLSFDLDFLKKNPNVVIPLETIKNIVPALGELVSIDGSHFSGKVQFVDSGSIDIDSFDVYLKGFDFKQSIIYSKNIADANGKLDVNSLYEFFLEKNGKINSNSIIPENADTNIATLGDLMSSEYIKAGDTVTLGIEQEPSLEDDVKPEIENHFKENPGDISFSNNYIVTKSDYKEVLSLILKQYATI